MIAEKFSFHKEYEERIAPKLADQEVEEQISKANAARQNQIFREVEATKKKRSPSPPTPVKWKSWSSAKAKAERDVRQAEAYVIDTQLGADATFYQRDKNAQAILVKQKQKVKHSPHSQMPTKALVVSISCRLRSESRRHENHRPTLHD